jgi:hypothetical protein
MLRLLLIFLLSITSAVADSKMGVMASFLYNVPDVKTSGALEDTTGNSKMGYGIAMRGLIPLSNSLYFRSGAGFVTKNFGYEGKDAASSSTVDLSFIYLNVPLTFYVTGMDEKIGVFGGLNLNARLGNSCKSSAAIDLCKNYDPKPMVFPLVFGFDFIFSKVFSMELGYEYAVMDTARNVKVSSAVLSFIYNFD